MKTKTKKLTEPVLRWYAEHPGFEKFQPGNRIQVEAKNGSLIDLMIYKNNKMSDLTVYLVDETNQHFYTFALCREYNNHSKDWSVPMNIFLRGPMRGENGQTILNVESTPKYWRYIFDGVRWVGKMLRGSTDNFTLDSMEVDYEKVG